MTFGILVPRRRVEPLPPAVGSSVLTAGPPGKPYCYCFNLLIFEVVCFVTVHSCYTRERGESQQIFFFFIEV